MSHPECAFDDRVIWCLSSAIFWITVIGVLKLVLYRMGQSGIYIDSSGLPQTENTDACKQPQKHFNTLNGHFNLSYLKNEFPSTSSIHTFKYAQSIEDLNSEDLRNLVNAYHRNITYATGLFSRNRQLFMATAHGIQTNLKNLLADKSVRFSRNLISSLMEDLTSGLCYLHHSPIRFHGELNSVNCVITSTMELKISNFGIAKLKSSQHKNDLYYFDVDLQKLWLAPEILRGHESQGSPEADVYAFSILLHEIIHRKGPFNIYTSTYINLEAIINDVGNSEVTHGKMELFRPLIEESIDLETGCPPAVRLCLEEAWSDDPTERPPMVEIYHRLSTIRNKYRKMPIDSSTAENEMERKLQMLRGEREKRLELLNELVPSKVVSCLFHDFAVKPTTFQSISVLFINICINASIIFYSEDEDFNPLGEHVKIFADVCKVIDELTLAYDVYKVETVKETYVVASGMDSSDNEQEREIALFALHLCSLTQSEELKELFENKVSIKMGIHKGSVAAGVIGLEKPKFCLFGDTVNMAARLCTTSELFKIQLSSQFNEALKVCGTFESSERGMIKIKGKGWHKTFWLTRSQHPFRITKKLLSSMK